MDVSNILNIDHLLKYNDGLYYLDKGCIQLCLSYGDLFFYLDKAKYRDIIHKTYFDSTVNVIKGNLLINKWKIIRGDSHTLISETTKGKELTKRKTSIILSNTHMYDNTDQFLLSSKEYHSVDYIDNTIAFRSNKEIVSNYVDIIYSDNCSTSPFNKKPSDIFLWEVIEDIIKN